MAFDIAGAAGAAAGLAQSIFGIGEKRQDRRQLQQQEKLNELNKKTQMDMWEATGYGAQKKQMKEAGLNPALMYGMGGGGGQSVGGAGAQAASGAAGTQASAAMGMQTAQLALLGAQKENIEADTENKKASTTNTGAETAGKEIDNRRNELETKLRENLGIGKLQQHEEIKIDAENRGRTREIREFEEWMGQAFTNELGQGTEVKKDALGEYITNNNDLIKEATRAGFQEKIQTVSNLVKDFELKGSQEKLNEIEAELRDFKVDMSKWGLNEQTTAILNTILKAIIGRR